MNRSRIIIPVAALVIAGVSVAAGAQGTFQNLVLHRNASGTSQASSQQDAVIANAALRAVSSHQADTLGMIAPQNAPAYAPIYPEGLILEERLADNNPNGGTVSYDAAAPVGVVLNFYKEAAEQAHLPVRAATLSADGGLLVAGDGQHQVTAKLTKQFANATVVDLTYG